MKLCLQCKLTGNFDGSRKICRKCFAHNTRNKIQFCAKCETLKSEIGFSKNHTICKECEMLYKMENMEHIKKKMAAWRAENAEHIAAYYSMPERIASIKKRKAAYNATPERRSKLNARLRNIEPANSETVDHIKWCLTQLCTYCWRQAESHDHVVPISRGGSNHWSNIVPACKQCNDSKGARSVSIWMLTLGPPAWRNA